MTSTRKTERSNARVSRHEAFAKALHGATLRVKDVPGVLLDVHFDDNGDLDRESFLVKVVSGKQVVTATLPPVNPIQ